MHNNSLRLLFHSGAQFMYILCKVVAKFLCVVHCKLTVGLTIPIIFLKQYLKAFLWSYCLIQKFTFDIKIFFPGLRFYKFFNMILDFLAVVWLCL